MQQKFHQGADSLSVITDIYALMKVSFSNHSWRHPYDPQLHCKLFHKYLSYYRCPPITRCDAGFDHPPKPWPVTKQIIQMSWNLAWIIQWAKLERLPRRFLIIDLWTEKLGTPAGPMRGQKSVFFWLKGHLSKIASVSPLIQPREVSMPNYSSFKKLVWSKLEGWSDNLHHIL